MKNLNEMNSKEISLLQTKDIELLVKERMMEEGVKLLPKPNNPVYEEIPNGDITLYTISEMYDIAFENEKDAQTIINTIRKSKSYKLTYDSTVGYQYKRIFRQRTTDDVPKIAVENIYSQELYERIRTKAIYNTQIKEEFDKKNGEFEYSLNKRNKIEREIIDYIKNKRKEYNQKLLFCKIFANEYYSLSNKDEEIAMRFMDKAFGLSEEEKDYILTNYKNYL